MKEFGVPLPSIIIKCIRLQQPGYYDVETRSAEGGYFIKAPDNIWNK